MHIIGLTGGIASGKSTVSAMLTELGACVIDADRVYQAIILPGLPLWQEIAGRFGNDIVLPDGQLDRQRLGDIIFHSSAERLWLDQTTHPFIAREMSERTETARQHGYPCVVWDVPLLFEAGWQDAVDEIWVVYVSLATQTERLMRRNAYTREQALLRVEAQMALAEKQRRADRVIDNDCPPAETQRQVTALWQAVQKRLGL